MLTLPEPIMTLLRPFRPLFCQPSWVKAQVLLLGAILSPGKRTVSAALQVMGLSEEVQYAKYHHLLNRAVWSAHRVAAVLLKLLLDYLDESQDALVFGLDETIERRWGAAIKARGI